MNTIETVLAKELERERRKNSELTTEIICLRHKLLETKQKMKATNQDFDKNFVSSKNAG